MIDFVRPLLLVALLVSPAWSQAPYYQGKTITMVVGYLPGAGYDI